eukprot:TRINITY_DN2922_c0_g1_i1.p1 TRINITY_DN2922_c0_g1~~TRINITY_DN2922_c0_g1_i1.p1  ORF type:complete len:340 (-),score=58.63 TRINITY_DN2922_c0_g1_i1:150-1142(-)
MERHCMAFVLCLVGLVSVVSGGLTSTNSQWRRHSRRVETSQSPVQHLINRRNSGYPVVDERQEEAAAQNTIDLHNKEFCVDVSTYQPVVWVESEAEECSTVFVKKCEEKSENVCTDVTETKCEVVPYTECSMGMEPQEFSQTILAPKKFVEKTCSQGRKVIPHIKMLPECRNVTKQNCVTLWETDPDGKQVWAGNEACEPVTWQECKLVPKNVKFIVPEINCTDGNEVWYHEPEVSTDIRMTNTFSCKVKSSSSCETQTRPDCKSITYQECREIPVTNCNPKSVHKPTQEKLHRKKCLLPDVEPAPAAEPASDGYGQPLAEPITSLPSYN